MGSQQLLIAEVNQAMCSLTHFVGAATETILGRSHFHNELSRQRLSGPEKADITAHSRHFSPISAFP
jgi:hypothetical protein